MLFKYPGFRGEPERRVNPADGGVNDVELGPRLRPGVLCGKCGQEEDGDKQPFHDAIEIRGLTRNCQSGFRSENHVRAWAWSEPSVAKPIDLYL